MSDLAQAIIVLSAVVSRFSLPVRYSVAGTMSSELGLYYRILSSVEKYHDCVSMHHVKL